MPLRSRAMLRVQFTGQDVRRPSSCSLQNGHTKLMWQSCNLACQGRWCSTVGYRQAGPGVALCQRPLLSDMLLCWHLCLVASGCLWLPGSSKLPGCLTCHCALHCCLQITPWNFPLMGEWIWEILGDLLHVDMLAHNNSGIACRGRNRRPETVVDYKREPHQQPRLLSSSEICVTSTPCDSVTAGTQLNCRLHHYAPAASGFE
jgi:hypothetical protein